MSWQNEGGLDRAIRVVGGLVLLLIGLFMLGGTAGATLGVVVAMIGVLGLVTGAVGWCFLYRILGISTTGRPIATV